MGFVNFSIVRFAFFLVFGILTAHHYQGFIFMLVPLLFCFFLSGFFWFLSRRQLIQKVYFGILVYGCFFGIGMVSYQIRLPQFQANHYSHSIEVEHSYLIQGKIKEILKPDSFNNKYLVEILAVNSSARKGKILMSISNDSMKTLLEVDDVLLCYAPFTGVPEPLNPNQIDYAQNLRNQGAYHQVRLSEEAIMNIRKGKPTLFGRAQKFRSALIDKLKQTKINPDEQAIIQGLVLGDRTDIDKQLYDAYAAAGAVHILAVSGLHVGVLFVLLSFLLRPLTRLKHGKVVRSLLIVIALWSFAFIAGLSPSIIRAVSMFCFFAFAQVLGRHTNGLNNLFLSFFFLLIINPLWLFQIGFQLSYMAVFFIFWLRPIFNRLGYSKYWLVRETKSLISVTLSAQLGVLPLTLFYFHQFPGLFLLTNSVILPVMSFVMIGGISIIGLAALNSLPDWLAEGYGTSISGINNFIGWVAGQEHFLFSDISFSTSKTIGAYVLIISVVFFVHKWNYKRLVLVSYAIALLLGVSIYDKAKASKPELLIFNKNRHTLIGYKNQRELKLFLNDTTMGSFDGSLIKSYQVKNNLRQITPTALPRIFRYGANTVLIVDSLGVFPSSSQIHTVVLTQSPKINLIRMIDSIQPERIIADGSNYPSFVNQWQQMCKEKEVAFHHTATLGAYFLKP